MIKLYFAGDPKIKRMLESRLAAALGEQVVSGDPPDIAVVVRRSRLGGVENAPQAVEGLLNAAVPPVVVAVIGSHEKEAQQLLSLGVPEECILRSPSVRLAELVETAAGVYRKGLRPVLLVYSEEERSEEAVDDLMYAEEKTVGSAARVGGDEDAGLQRGLGRLFWFGSPTAGAGQTTLLASVAAVVTLSVGERVAVLDLFRPPAAYLHFGGEAISFERQGNLLRGETPWGVVCVPAPEITLNRQVCREITASLAREFDLCLVDAPAGVCEPDVVVVRGDPQAVRLLKGLDRKADALLVLSLGSADSAGPEYLQSVLEREVGRRADVVMPFDPDVAKAVDRPASEVSGAVGRAAAELASLLGERVAT